jgi:NTP pyrophosphatase (non-canonical NTP hydrolase)
MDKNKALNDYLDGLEYGLDLLAKELHDTAKEKGFWDYEVDFIFAAKQIAMIHSEATEVLEALRKSQGEEKVVEELADIIVRVLDLWAGLVEAGIVSTSLDEAMANKISVNKSREKLHGVLG